MEDAGQIHFGRFVRWHRINRFSMSQAELGERLGVSGRQVSSIESQPEPKLRPKTWRNLAQMFGRTPDDLGALWKEQPYPHVPDPRGEANRVAEDSLRIVLSGVAAVAVAEAAEAMGIRPADLVTVILLGQGDLKAAYQLCLPKRTASKRGAEVNKGQIETGDY